MQNLAVFLLRVLVGFSMFCIDKDFLFFLLCLLCLSLLIVLFFVNSMVVTVLLFVSL